jgi:hypothetical protein
LRFLSDAPELFLQLTLSQPCLPSLHPEEEEEEEVKEEKEERRQGQVATLHRRHCRRRRLHLLFPVLLLPALLP